MVGAGIDIDWTKLIHAFGSAANIPGHVSDWRGTHPRRKLDSETYLRHASFAHGLWPATAPTTLVLMEFLNSPDIDDAYLPLLFIDRIAHECDFRGGTDAVRETIATRADGIASWTTAYANADRDERDRLRGDGSGLADLVNDQSRLACYDLVPQLLTAVLPWMHDSRIGRRSWIAATIAAMARHPDLADQRPTLTATIERATITEPDDRELATLLIALGDLGSASQAWLDHQHIGVQISAAIALALTGDDAGATVLRTAARDRTAYFASFGDVAPPTQFMTPPHGRDALAEALRLVDGDAR